MNKTRTNGLTFLRGMAPHALADEWNQNTILTFSGPDFSAGRNVVQVFSAIPDRRLRPARKPIIPFEETPAGSPEPVRGPGLSRREVGHEIVYREAKAIASMHAAFAADIGNPSPA